jgi:arabinose-5-phosphate isomerase
MDSNNFDYLAMARQVLHDEAQGLDHLSEIINGSFVAACQLISDCQGRVILCGIGKSGHIGRKIAASFASLGRPSFFLHAAEAVHGDLGMVTAADIIILISNSGESKELLNMLPSLKRIGAKRIAVTSKPESTLGKNCDLILNLGVSREADPLGLAPTTSAVVTLALGDALAIAVAAGRGFAPMDFALFHPGGALGRMLLGNEAV